MHQYCPPCKRINSLLSKLILKSKNHLKPHENGTLLSHLFMASLTYHKGVIHKQQVIYMNSIPPLTSHLPSRKISPVRSLLQKATKYLCSNYIQPPGIMKEPCRFAINKYKNFVVEMCTILSNQSISPLISSSLKLPIRRK